MLVYVDPAILASNVTFKAIHKPLAMGSAYNTVGRAQCRGECILSTFEVQLKTQNGIEGSNTRIISGIEVTLVFPRVWRCRF
jgi:hypothetical protein